MGTTDPSAAILDLCDRIEGLAAKATDRPWAVYGDGHPKVPGDLFYNGEIDIKSEACTFVKSITTMMNRCHGETIANAHLIVAACNATPMLAAEVRRLTAHVATAARDWADDHTHLQTLCLAVGVPKERVEGDKDHFVGIEEIANLLADRCESADHTLRELACYLSAGGFNAPDPIDHAEYAKKIKWGIDEAVRLATERLRAVVHPWYGPCDGHGENGRCSECLRLTKIPYEEWTDRVSAARIGQLMAENIRLESELVRTARESAEWKAEADRLRAERDGAVAETLRWAERVCREQAVITLESKNPYVILHRTADYLAAGPAPRAEGGGT